jgi:hypothetical protein
LAEEPTEDAARASVVEISIWAVPLCSASRARLTSRGGHALFPEPVALAGSRGHSGSKSLPVGRQRQGPARGCTSRRTGHWLTARRALELGTIEGARSMGIDEQVGSLKPGKRADIITVTTRALNMGGFADPAHLLIGSALPENVDTVVIDGRILKRDGKLTALSGWSNSEGVIVRGEIPERSSLSRTSGSE